MIRVAINRLIYMMLIFIGVILLWYKQYIAFAIPIFVYVGVDKVFWKNFHIAKKLMYKKRYKSAVEKFDLFLKDLEEKPWLNNLKVFNIGIYTHDLKAKVYNNIGLCYFESKSYKRAEEFFNKAIKEDDKFCLPNYNLSIIYLIKNKEEKANENLKTAIKKGYNKINFGQLKSYVYIKYKLQEEE